MYAIQIDIESMHQFSLFRDHDDNEVCLPEKQGATKQFDSGESNPVIPVTGITNIRGFGVLTPLHD